MFVIVSQFACAKVVKLDVYRSWSGKHSEYKSDKPFFIIYDLYELERFWKKCNSDEQMPWIDFDKCMLFVWHPGQLLASYREARVTNFLFKDNKYVILMDFAKSFGGGGWKHPFLATLLPKVKRGDIFVMKTKTKRYGEIQWVPVYSLWDMQQSRTAPFQMVKQDEPPKRIGLITHAPKAKVSRSRVANTTAPKRPKPTVQLAQNRKTKKPEHSFNSKDIKTTNSSKSSRPVSNKTTSIKTKPVKQTKKNKKVYDEDIFGQEFDISF